MRTAEIIEMGLRDGLQNQKIHLDYATRVALCQKLIKSGLKRIEVGAFVSPKWVPEMAMSKKLVTRLIRDQKKEKIGRDVRFSALVPNLRGMETALDTGIKEVAVFTAATESFCQKNINCSIEESIQKFSDVIKVARKNRVKIRGYLSTCFGCPFEGEVKVSQVMKVARRLYDLGVSELSVGDTIGVGNPRQVEKILNSLVKEIPAKKLAMHFHDTRGTALANVLASLEFGVNKFDSSVGGIGGCPYAPGALGNVATEDLVFMLEGMGVKTGVNLEQLLNTHGYLERKMGIRLPSRVGQAGLP